MQDNVNPSGESDEALDKRWHLASSPLDVEATEFEYALMRAFEAFGRWQSACLALVINLAASGPENAILHVIRMHERPKSIKDIAKLLNRDDFPNIQYSLRKLIGAGLVMRQGSGRSGVTYSVTEAGREVTNRYARVRKALLMQAIEDLPDFKGKLHETTKSLELMTGIYEQVARTAVTHRRPEE